jgi:putative membrane protein
MMRFGYGGWWMWLGGFLMVVVIALAIYALVVLISRSGKTDSHSLNEQQQDKTGSALVILAERYARGEINEEEYQQKKATLKNL